MTCQTFTALSEPTLTRAQLEERILSTVPVTQQAFSKLLSLLEIKLSQDIPSACVTLGQRSRLLVNPDFVSTWCKTDESLAILIMHELLHILLGHTRLFERTNPIQNLAFDAIINAQLCLLFPSPAWTALFRNLYNATDFPTALLRPPDGWGTRKIHWALTGTAGRLHRALYTDSSVTYRELFELFSQLDNKENITELTLLGNHEVVTETEAADPELLREITNIVAKWPMIEQRSGRDEGGKLQDDNLNPSSPRRVAIRILRKALLQVADLGLNETGIPRLETTQTETVNPYQTQWDRRATISNLFGHDPIFYQGETTHAGLSRSERVHVYLDVSGSMGNALPLLYGALIPLSAFLHEDVHLFSTVIKDITLTQLRSGKVRSSYGTNINPVTEHLLTNKIRRAVIITDGWVGEVSSEHAKRLHQNRARINCVITANGDPSFASVFTGKTWQLPDLN